MTIRCNISCVAAHRHLGCVVVIWLTDISMDKIGQAAAHGLLKNPGG